MQFRSLAALAAVVAGASCAMGSVFHDDAIHGDLSDDRFNPTVFNLGVGVNTIISETGLSNLPAPEGDRDYFTLVVGAGQTLTSITLVESVNVGGGGFDPVAFIGLQFGPMVTVDPDAPNPAPLAGWTLSTPDAVGTDLMSVLTGGLTELGPGEYAFWVQQTGEDITRVRLDFNVVPAPGAVALLGLGGLVSTRRRR